jgi:hypothetical protein
MARHPLAHEGGGDDLDDGLELDESLLASDEEADDDIAEQGDGWMTDDEEPVSKKRVRQAEEEEQAQGEGGEEDEKARKKRRRDKDKARRAAKVRPQTQGKADNSVRRLTATRRSRTHLRSTPRRWPSSSSPVCARPCPLLRRWRLTTWLWMVSRVGGVAPHDEAERK